MTLYLIIRTKAKSPPRVTGAYTSESARTLAIKEFLEQKGIVTTPKYNKYSVLEYVCPGNIKYTYQEIELDDAFRDNGR